jgi:hypothetical protein
MDWTSLNNRKNTRWRKIRRVKMKKLADKITGLKFMISCLVFSLATKAALAAGPAVNGINTVDKGTMATKLKTAYDSVIFVAGGTAMLIGMAIVAFTLILSHKNHDKRTSAMTSLLSVGGGCALLGAAAVVAGFFFGLGQ